MTPIRTYDGYFTFAILPPEKADHLDHLFNDKGVDVDLALQSLEFSWMGPERDSMIVQLFKEFAVTVGEAEGELRCEIDDENVDPRFEFFTVAGGQLLVQRGSLVRDNERCAVV